MEKKTFEQIMAIVKEKFDDVDAFDSLEVPSTWVESDVSKNARILKQKYFEDNNKPKYDTPEYKVYSEMPNSWDITKNEFLTSLGLGPIDELEEVGGGEGEGEEYYKVLYFPDHDVYIRIDGTYYSHDGVNFYGGWKSCSEVRPVDRVVTFYE